MKKIILTVARIVIILFGLSAFGWMVSHIEKGDKEFGFLTGPVKGIYTFLDLFERSVEEVKTLPKTFVPTPEDFEPINRLDSDLIVLSTYSDVRNTRSVALMNLRNDSVLYKWNYRNPFKPTNRCINPLLFPDRSLVYAFSSATGPRRIDSLSNVIWEQDSIRAHHSMELDSAGNIWLCSFEPVWYATGHYRMNGRDFFFIDNYITKLDPETGHMLFHQSVTDILASNGLSQYLLKSTNIRDPLHINDVQPALKTTSYYREGDVFISIKNLSLVIHYRPASNEVLKVIEGPFVAQHDVDFLGDSSLVIFNNNNHTHLVLDSKDRPKDSSKLDFAGDFYSNLARYDLWNDSLSFIGDSVFRANCIHTFSEGLMEFLDPSTYFVEEQNTGLLWVIENDEVVYKNVLNSQHEGHHHLPNWIRIIGAYE